MVDSAMALRTMLARSRMDEEGAERTSAATTGRYNASEAVATLEHFPT